MEPEGSFPHLHSSTNCPYSQPEQSTPCLPHPTSWRSILILPSHLTLGLPSFPFRQVSPTETLYAPLLSSHTSYLPSTYLSFWFCLSSNIWWGLQIINFLVTSSSPLPCSLVPLRTTYSQRPVLEHPHPILIPQWVSHPYVRYDNRIKVWITNF